MDIKFNTPYQIEKEKKILLERILKVVFNQYLAFISGCLFVFFRNNIVLSLLFLIIGLIPVFMPINITVNEKI